LLGNSLYSFSSAIAISDWYWISTLQINIIFTGIYQPIIS
jgi:hypothetical protein